MFSNKQSDIFYNDETKEMFVCTVSAISAERCEDNITVYGALPLIYKINKSDNYKKLVYPKNLDTFLTDTNSDLYNLTPTCAITGTNFDSITKPLINYNKSTSRYSVTFLGKYITDTEGLGLNNYIFQDINSDFYLLDANIYIPKDKDVAADKFTFENGYLNSDLYVVGNTIRNQKPSWFNPADALYERSCDYQIAPMYVQATSSLGFNLTLGKVDTGVDNLIGDIAFPFMYSGGFITYNPKYTAYDPQYTIRVDFTARSFNVPSPTAYGSTMSVGTSATRWISQYDPAGSGEGFCVSFFKNPPVSSYVIPNGIGSTLGYAKAGFSPVEVAGTAQATDGLYIHNDWNPNTGASTIKGSIGDGTFGPAESFLGVGFDIGGNFATTSEEKEKWWNSSASAPMNNSTWTATPCSIGIRASSYYDTQVLTAIAMNTVAASAVPMHTSAADAEFVDYRVDLTNKGTKVTIYNKLTSATDYNTILEYRLNKAEGCVGVGIGSSHSTTYQPWYGMQSSYQQATNTLPLLNVGLSFTTSDEVSRFELHKFEVTGVVVNKPWLERKDEPTGRFAKETTASVTQKIDYLQESSKNLRKRLINVESDDLVDVEMVVPAKKIIANTINEETNKPQITMCEGSNPVILEDDVDIKITGLRPQQVDKVIEVGESGNTPKVPDTVTTIGSVGRDLELEITETGETTSWDSWIECKIPDSHFTYPVPDADDEAPVPGNRLHHTGRVAWLHMTDRKYHIYLQVLVLDDFAPTHHDDHNDWFVVHPFGPDWKHPRARTGVDSRYVNNILLSVIRAFIQSDVVGGESQYKPAQPFTDSTKCNYALQWRALPERPTDLHKNELLERKKDDGSFYIGDLEENWVANFKEIGFIHLPSDWQDPSHNAFGNNTLTPGTVEFFGNDWACANSWDELEGGDVVSTGVTTKPTPWVLTQVIEGRKDKQ
jgi:hypothetical protein